MDEEECTCGHVYDEHVVALRVQGNQMGPCTIDDCWCVYYEAIGDDE